MQKATKEACRSVMTADEMCVSVLSEKNLGKVDGARVVDPEKYRKILSKCNLQQYAHTPVCWVY